MHGRFRHGEHLRRASQKEKGSAQRQEQDTTAYLSLRYQRRPPLQHPQ